ncbi:hypothetical protein [Streptomyces stelliscabiei]|uniref:hypothetical protein n=1 Tax=Streptomyces stelliscabiei TaxID=146820 RepID=UPI0029AB66BA|nr:hypothetical protein [Streptomyces stelliscabiei]MDX2514585.1 hypothetical protein [Streptomyces stelliscabiei]MDX2661147.1 hypothetical protein [Streptomyces stelliscabiei]MDX2790124.1 hypothetical protein [Streptomyces stelliscabiei]
MADRIPPAHNHWPLALARYSSDPEPLELPDHHRPMPLLWASPPCPPTRSTSGLRNSARAEDPRSRIARRLAVELGTSSTWDLIREAQTSRLQVVTVENVIETAVWLTSHVYGE